MKITIATCDYDIRNRQVHISDRCLCHRCTLTQTALNVYLLTLMEIILVDQYVNRCKLLLYLFITFVKKCVDANVTNRWIIHGRSLPPGRAPAQGKWWGHNRIRARVQTTGGLRQARGTKFLRMDRRITSQSQLNFFCLPQVGPRGETISTTEKT